MLVESGQNELIVGRDAAGRVEVQELEPHREHLVRTLRPHLPGEGHDVAKPLGILSGAEDVAVVAHVLVVRSLDALLERCMAARLDVADIVRSLFAPERGDRLTSLALVGLVPCRGITLRQLLCALHDFASVFALVMGANVRPRAVAKNRRDRYALISST